MSPWHLTSPFHTPGPRFSDNTIQPWLFWGPYTLREIPRKTGYGRGAFEEGSGPRVLLKGAFRLSARLHPLVSS